MAVQRGDNGIVLVNLGSSSSVSVTTKGMKDGTYTDAVSGNTFTVKNGKISGTIGSSDIAVVYEGSSTTPKANFSVLDKTSFKTDTMDITLTLENAVSGTYSINGAAPVTFKNNDTIKIGEGITSGDITVTLTATDGKKTTETTNTYTKLEVTHTGLFVYLNKDGNKMTKNWKNALIYAFYEEKDSSGKPKYKYYLIVDRKGNTVTVYTYDEDGKYSKPVFSMICSTGSGTPMTPVEATATSWGSHENALDTASTSA